MKRFVSICQSIFYRKSTLGIAVLAILGMVGGGKLVLQSHQFATTANCLSYSVGACNTARHAGAIHPTDEYVVGQTNPIQPQPKKTTKVKLKPPPATSAIRVYPTPVSTSPPVHVDPTPTSPSPGQSSVASMIVQVFGPYAQSALKVAKCESGLNPGAYNPTSIGGSHAAGVFQILYPSTWARTSEAGYSPYDALANIRAAHEIFVRDGYNWHEWSCPA